MAWSNDDSGNRGGDFGGVDGGFSGGFGEGGPGGDGEGSRGIGTTHDSDSDNNATPRTGTNGGTSGATSSDSSTSDPRTSTRAAREDVNARRDAFGLESALSAFDLTQDLGANQAAASDRINNYTPSSSADRRGTSITQGGNAPGAGSVRDGVADAYGNQVSGGGMGLLAGFVPGGRAMVDTVAENKMTKAVTGNNMSLGDAALDFGKNVAIDAMGTAIGGPVTSAFARAGYGLGGMAGAIGGGLLASAGINKMQGAVDEAITYGGPAGEPFQPGYDGDSDFNGTLRPGLLNPAVVDAAPTGYNSSFGDYASHINRGYGFRGAFDAFS